MSLTLNRQMDTLFQNGMKVIKLHQQEITEEWQSILLHLENTGRKSATMMRKTIIYFSTLLFSEKEDEMKKLIQDSEHQEFIPFKTNQFVITLLENAVYKAIQSSSNYTHNDRQAIQYLFSTISEDILIQPYQQFFSIDSFLKNLVFSNQLPIEWAAVVIKENQSFIVEKWFHKQKQASLFNNPNLKTDTIYGLSEKLLEKVTRRNRKKYNVLPVPHEEITILFCIKHEDTSHVMPFITHALQIFQHGKNTFEVTQQEQNWKDSVIMFNETMLRTRSFDEAVENITSGFINYLPFERCALFSYLGNEEMNVGLHGHRLDSNAIRNITEDMNNLPLIQNNMQLLNIFGKNMDYIQPMYMKDATAGLPEQYIKQFNLRSIVVVPIFLASNNTFLGAAILDQGPGKYFEVTQETFSALVKFGQSAGEVLAKYYEKNEKSTTVHLSLREVDVLKLMAEGASTIEAASELNLSEYTVRDYISTIMQKMNAKNRTEAVARAIREGII